MPGPSSWPCKGRPASRRSVSRAPRPAGLTPAATTARQKARGDLGGDGALDAVLARVAGAGDSARHPFELEVRHGEVAHRRCLGGDARQALARLRPLHGDDRPLLGHVVAADDRDDPVGVGGVRHDVETLLLHPPDDDVVQHGGVLLVEQVLVLGPPGPDLVQVVGERPSAGARRSPGRSGGRCRGGSRRTRPRRSYRRGARRWCRPGTKAASPSRRSPPVSRRARRARRARRSV